MTPSCSWIAATGGVHLAREEPRPGQKSRVGEQREQGQPRRQVHQQPDGRRVDERRVAEVEQPRPEHRPHRAEVVGQPRHHVAGRVPPVKPGVEPQEVPEEVAPQPVLDVPSGVEDEDARPGPDERLPDRERGDEGGVADHQGVQPPGRPGAPAERVDRPLDQPGDRQRERVGGAKAEAAEKDAGQLRPQPRAQARTAHAPGGGRSRRGGTRASIRDRVRIFPLSSRLNRGKAWIYSRESFFPLPAAPSP